MLMATAETPAILSGRGGVDLSVGPAAGLIAIVVATIMVPRGFNTPVQVIPAKVMLDRRARAAALKYPFRRYTTLTGALAPFNPVVVNMNDSALAPAGGDQPHNNMQPYLTLNFCIALQGVFPRALNFTESL